MATQICRSAVSSNVTVYQLGEADNLIVTSAGAITETGFKPAIGGTGSGHVVTVQGTVSSEGRGISLGDNSELDSHQVVRVSTSASVLASANYNGITLVGHDSAIYNDGVVFGTNAILSSGTTGSSTVVNTGTIIGQNGLYFDGAQTGIISNSGVIEGSTDSIIASDLSIMKINNSGSISGAIKFGIYNDVYEGVSGRLNGEIYCNAGDDVVTTGIDDDKVYGQAGVDKISTGAGNDLIDGGTEADTMSGGTGNDTYYVDLKADKIVETSGQGTDTVFAASSYDLVTGVSVETLQVSAPFAVVATLVGNEFGQTIVGGDTANGINGRAGNDTLTGGLGNDSFYFDRALGTGNVDHITDYANVSGNNDTIRLDDAIFNGLATGTWALAAFRANATGTAADLDDRIILETDTGKLFYDADGNKVGGVAAIQFAIIDNYAMLTDTAALKNADFLIY